MARIRANQSTVSYDVTISTFGLKGHSVVTQLTSAESKLLSDAISALESDFSFLDKLLVTLTPEITSSSPDIAVRAHYLPFRNGKPMTGELLDTIRAYICNFALSRAEIEDTHSLVKTSSPQDAMIAYNRLRDTASDIYIKAQKSTNRNGECGELLLYLLIEWFLKAPQVVAKMSLKTSTTMPVHGSDGIHVRYDQANDKLWFIWGESKLHASLDGAISAALKSVGEALKYEKQKTDLNLVKRNFDVSGLPTTVKATFLNHLNPLHESYFNKLDVSACLIGFDFDGFATLGSVRGNTLEDEFRKSLRTELVGACNKLQTATAANGITHHRLEMFFLPFESVDQLRIDFQNLIGWKS